MKDDAKTARLMKVRHININNILNVVLINLLFDILNRALVLTILIYIYISKTISSRSLIRFSFDIDLADKSYKVRSFAI
jgi:hypothetical protein